jgi:hypothetical protein
LAAFPALGEVPIGGDADRNVLRRDGRATESGRLPDSRRSIAVVNFSVGRAGCPRKYVLRRTAQTDYA